MDTITRALLGFAALWLLGMFAVRARMALGLYRTRLSPLDGEPVFDDVSPLPALDAPEAAGVAELEALGFATTAEWLDCHGHEPARVVHMALADHRAFAHVTLLGSSLYGYHVAFHSFDRGDRQLSTVNRVGWFLVAGIDSSEVIDACADSLADHWAAHQARMADAQALDPALAARRVRERALQDGRTALASGAWARGARGAHLSLRNAIRVTNAVMRDRKRLGRPFRSPLTSGELVPQFLRNLLATSDRAAARTREGIGAMKSMLLLVSMVAGLWIWGIAFDWRTAALLVGVLLVHESGHALAMRLFGWRDLHMFFVPLMGAVVTGKRPRELPAWKEAIVLFAGPVPGLLAGLALLAQPQPLSPLLHSLATMAVIVNAFNLLPLMPLDGGRLVEIALFSRWPRGRVLLLAASAAGLFAFAWALEAPLAAALGLLLVLSLRRQWGLVSLEQAVIAPGAVEGDALVERVARVVHERHAAAALPMKVVLAAAVLARRRIRAARLAESVSIVLLLLALGALVVAPMTRLLSASGRLPHAAQPTRTAVQATFDRAWFDGAREPSPAQWATLLASEAALKAGDPRHRDVEWLRTQQLAPAERMQAVDRWLAVRGNGSHESREEVVWQELDARIRSAAMLAPPARLEPLAAAVAWAQALQPRMVGPAIALRLRLAEATDLAGNPAEASRLLDEIDANAPRGPDGRVRIPAIARARTWFALAHGQPDVALRVLEAADPALARGAPDDVLAVDHAWARLFAGQLEGAFIDMRAAFHAEPAAPGAPPRDDSEFDADEAMDLVVAEARAGHVDAARELAQAAGRPGCEDDATRVVGDTVPEGPWQVARVRERVTLARAWCGSVAASEPAR